MPKTTIELEFPPVSLVVAAYNEERRLAATLASILESGFPCELVVVDDGSTDTTPAILASFEGRLQRVTHTANCGKGAAMASGVRQASGEIVVFCDAHLVGLTRYHLLALVLPLLYGSARAVLGVDVPEEVSLALTRAVSPGVLLTGQRAYWRADLLPLLAAMGSLGYGVETFLFTKFPRDRTAVVLLPGLAHLQKRETSSAAAAAAAYLREVLEILDTLVRVRGVVPGEVAQIRRQVAALFARYANPSHRK